MTPDEAWVHIQNGGIVTWGGYYFGKGFYLSWGTYPGCKRAGEADPRNLKYKSHSNWRAITESELVDKFKDDK